MSGFSVQTKITGDKELVQKLKHLRGSGQRRSTKSAVSFSLTPLNRESKKSVPVETGQLKKSLARKVKAYPAKGMTFGVVGVKRNSKNAETGRNPAKYLHLVELGVKSHTIRHEKKKALLVRTRGKHGVGYERFASRVKHSGFIAKAPLKKAFDSGKGEALRRFNQKLGERIEIEARKTT